MPRIEPVTESQMLSRSRELLEPSIRKRGRAPNIYAAFAHSPAALEYLLGGGRAMGKMSIPAKMREAVTLAIAALNDCKYCVAAHADLAGKLGVEEDEWRRNLRGESSDPKTAAAIDFAKALLTREGYVTDEQLQAARDAGFSEGEIIELIVVVAHNLLTSYFNHVAQTDIDFPVVEMPHAAAK